MFQEVRKRSCLKKNFKRRIEQRLEGAKTEPSYSSSSPGKEGSSSGNRQQEHTSNVQRTSGANQVKQSKEGEVTHLIY